MEDEGKLRSLCLTGVSPNGKDIGVGAYGKVFEVNYCGSVFAAKEIHPILVKGVRQEEFEATKRAFLTECVQSSALSHPNIVQFLGVYNPGGQSLLPVLVMEKMQESLTSLVEKYPNIPLYVKLSILLDVSKGLWYLHSHDLPIIHRDLSPNNILLTGQLVAKISDLGVAKVIQADNKKTKTRAPGTVDFMPPEALLDRPEYGPPLDVFSYGGVILHVVNQEWPEPLHFVTVDPKTKMPIGLTEVERRQEHIRKMTDRPVDLQRLVEECLDNDPNKRPPIPDVSERVKRMKELEIVNCPDVKKVMDPITWQLDQTIEVIKETTIAPAVKIPSRPHVKIFSKQVKVTWEEIAPLPVCRTAHKAVFLHGLVYVGGGCEGRNDKGMKDCQRLDVYNLTTNQWSTSPLPTPCISFAMTALDNKLIIAGGESLSKDRKIINEVYVLCKCASNAQWKDYSKMPTARAEATAVGYQSKLIVVGGVTWRERILTRLSTVELLDTTGERWYTCSNLPSPHAQLTGVVVDDTLYLLGGRGQDSPSSQVFAVSLSSLSTHQLTWQSLMCTPCCASAGVALYNKYLLAVGGRKQSDDASQANAIHALNPTTGSWVHIADIPAGRSRTAVVAVADNRIMCIGGATRPTIDQNFSNVVWIGAFE